MSFFVCQIAPPFLRIIAYGEELVTYNALKEKTIEELITELMATCGLGNIISPIKPVSGGFMHRMYRVTTDCGTYAVKHLNPEIMGRSGVFDNYSEKEQDIL